MIAVWYSFLFQADPNLSIKAYEFLRHAPEDILPAAQRDRTMIPTGQALAPLNGPLQSSGPHPWHEERYLRLDVSFVTWS
jgi:hypothetical protein